MTPLGQGRMKKAVKKLNAVYDSIPSTKGCLEHINKPEEEGGCGAWCCLLPNETVYTPDGPRKISDIHAGDLVFGRNGICTVVSSMSRMVNEDIAVINTRYGRTLKVTKDHSILCDLVSRKLRAKGNFSFVEAQHINTGNAKRENQHYIYFPKIANFIKQDNSPLKFDLCDPLNVYLDVQTQKVFNSYRKRGLSFSRIIEFDQEWAWILGLYLAEGSCEDSNVAFHINLDEKNIAERIEAFAIKIGAKHSCKINKGKSYTIRIFSSVLSKFMRFAGNEHCYRKRVDSHILREIFSRTDLLKSLHDGYYAGDGAKNGAYSITTTSKGLAEQILFINLLMNRFCGFSSSVRDGTRHTFYTCYDSEKNHDFIETDTYFAIPIDCVDFVRYAGPVFDIEVESDHVFCTNAGVVHNCQIQQPQVLRVEFLNTWQTLLSTWGLDKIVSLIDAALRNYLSTVPTKGCVFFDKESKMCQVHESRPYACRVYGITPEEEFTPRLLRLKVLYQSDDRATFREQCKLVSTKSGKRITVKRMDDWWLGLSRIEESIGIPKALISEEPGGMYRTFPEHILMHLFSEKAIASMQVMRVHGTDEEKEKFVTIYVDSVQKRLKSILNADETNKNIEDEVRPEA